MKLITAIIQPARLQNVADSLDAPGVSGRTVTEVSGHGPQHGHTEVYRGVEYRVDMVAKVRLETLVEDEQAQAVLDAIVGAARTGNVGDGKVWTVPVESVVRVRTGEVGAAAL